MKTSDCMFALLLAAALGCSDSAIIGGVCPAECPAGKCTAGVCVLDPGMDACPGGDCDADTSYDACAADGCGHDAGTRCSSGAADGCGTDAGPVCSSGAYELARSQLSLLFVVDDAASLAPWWDALRTGLDEFLQQSESTGLVVGLSQFAESCDAQAYVQPIVPMASLPGNLSAMQQAVPLAAAKGDTSTIPAFDGALQYARSWAEANASGRTAVVLLTDASPGACDALSGDYDAEVSRIARAGFDATPPVKTYVIGVSLLPWLAPIPPAGGTELMWINILPADGEVRTALENVRADAQPCAFRWQPEWTLAADTEVVSSSGGQTRRLPILANASECAQRDGFYVGDLGATYPLVACPRTCTSLTGSPQLTLSSACRAR